jgi:hypothetical protein
MPSRLLHYQVMADDVPAGPTTALTDTSLRQNGNRRLELLEQLLDEMSAAPTRDQRHWESLSVMIVDAA